MLHRKRSTGKVFTRLCERDSYYLVFVNRTLESYEILSSKVNRPIVETTSAASIHEQMVSILPSAYPERAIRDLLRVYLVFQFRRSFLSTDFNVVLFERRNAWTITFASRTSQHVFSFVYQPCVVYMYK